MYIYENLQSENCWIFSSVKTSLKISGFYTISFLISALCLVQIDMQINNDVEMSFTFLRKL